MEQLRDSPRTFWHPQALAQLEEGIQAWPPMPPLPDASELSGEWLQRESHQ